MENPNKENDISEENLQKKRIEFENLYHQQQLARDNQKQEKLTHKEITKDPQEMMLQIQKTFLQDFTTLKTLISTYKPETPLESLFGKLNDLKNYFISKNHALTTYDKQQYKQNLDSIELSLYQLKDKVQPRKRFVFRKTDKGTKMDEEQIKTEDIKTNEKNIFQIDGIIGLSNENKIINNENGFTSFQIEGNVGCEIEVNSLFDCLFIKNNKKCVIKVGPAKSSVFVDNNQECDIHIIGHQVRIHNCKTVNFYLFSSSKSIIEHCSNLIFQKYNHSYLHFEKDFETSGLSLKENLWQEIQDFNWLRQEKSPNFSIKAGLN